MVSTSTTTWEYGNTPVTIEVHMEEAFLLNEEYAQSLLEQFKATLSGLGYTYKQIASAFKEDED